MAANPRAILTLLVLPTLCGCAMTMSDAAVAEFKNRYPLESSCPPTVRERPEMESLVGEAVYEVTACSRDVLYLCSGGHTGVQNFNQGNHDSACTATTWCTPDGCDSVEIAARNAFVKEQSCPLERVSATTRAPNLPAAPPDVAADQGRMQVWTQTQKEKVDGHTFMTAVGCGSTVAYDCTKRSGVPRAMPVCVIDANVAAP
jgi:hypothetical protein